MQERYVILDTYGNSLDASKIPLWQKNLHRFLVRSSPNPDGLPDVFRIRGRPVQIETKESPEVLRMMVVAKWLGKPKLMALRDALVKDIWFPLCRKLGLDSEEFPIQEDRCGLENRGGGRFTVVLPFSAALNVIKETWKSCEIFAVPFSIVNLMKGAEGEWVRATPGAKTKREEIIRFLFEKMREKMPTSPQQINWTEVKSLKDLLKLSWFFPSGTNTAFTFVPCTQDLEVLASSLRPVSEFWDWIHLQFLNGSWVLPQPSKERRMQDDKNVSAETNPLLAAKLFTQTPVKWTQQLAEKALRGLPIKQPFMVMEFESEEEAKFFFEFSWAMGETTFFILHPALEMETADAWDLLRNEKDQMQKFRTLRAK